MALIKAKKPFSHVMQWLPGQNASRFLWSFSVLITPNTNINFENNLQTPISIYLYSCTMQIIPLQLQPPRGRHLAFSWVIELTASSSHGTYFWSDLFGISHVMGNVFKKRTRNRNAEERSAALSRSISLHVNKNLNQFHRHHRLFAHGLPSAVGSLFAG